MKHILVVDDIAANRYLLEATLKAFGIEVTTANDGEQALASARSSPPDLVISDILMPVMDGFALCRHWRSEEPLRRIPFIFYTATYTDARDEQLAMEVGADCFVIKPQEPQVLIELIHDVLARGAKSAAETVASKTHDVETTTLREYNEVLVRKLEKKVIELEAAREALEADARQRRQIEEALQRSEERWRLIYETEPECVKIVSADGRLETMNPAGLAMIGATSLEEVCGVSTLDLISPEHRDAFAAMHQDVISGQARRLVFEIIGLNGTRRWMETHAVPLYNADGTVSQLGITHDITERRLSHKTLVESERRFRDIYENSRDAVFVEDSTGHLLDVNPAACRLHGLTREQLLTKNVRDLVPLEHRANVDHKFSRLVRGELEQTEGFSLHADGTAVPVELSVSRILYNGQPALLLHVRDITERRKVEEILRASEARLQLFVSQIPAVLWATDRDLRFTSSTGAALKGLGLLPGQVVGLHLFDYFQSDNRDLPPIVAHYRALNGEAVQFDFEWGGRTFESKVEPLLDLDGNIIGVLGLAFDNTDRQRAKTDLTASRERLAILSRQLIETQEFERRHLARELHDEIGQSLTGIRLNLKALQQPTLTPQSSMLVQDTIGVVSQTLQQVRNMALDLRPSILDDIGLVAALRFCLDRQSKRAGFAPQFVAGSSISATSPEINTACFRIMQESLTNISRYANARNVRVELHQNDSSLELLVADDGVGFDVLAAQSSARRGASIGLLGMEERADLLGGQVEIQSILGQGTTVRARFPLTSHNS